MKKTNKKPVVKVTYIELRPGFVAPQFDIGKKTDAVKMVREMRGKW